MVCNIDYRNSFFFYPHFKTCGVNCSQFLSRDSSYQGHSVNQNYYTAMASMKKKGIKNDLKSGTQGTGHSIITMQLVTPFCACEFLAKNKMTVIPNPVLMPCDTFLIKKKKNQAIFQDALVELQTMHSMKCFIWDCDWKEQWFRG